MQTADRDKKTTMPRLGGRPTAKPAGTIDLSDPVIAAVRTAEEFESAVNTGVAAVFMLKADVLTLEDMMRRKNGKKVFVHIDMADGIGKDRRGVEYIARCGADGIITTKNHMVTAARDCGLIAVQRFFIIDSGSALSALDSVRLARPDYAELMPGVIPKEIARFVKSVHIPIIAGGLIEDKQDIVTALSAGAEGVSTGKRALWTM